MLSPGTTLGPYAVTAKIGEGGMGQVYQATDTKPGGVNLKAPLAVGADKFEQRVQVTKMTA